MNISDNTTKNALVDRLLKAGHIDLAEAKELLSVETQYQFVPFGNTYAPVATGKIGVANTSSTGTVVDWGDGVPVSWNGLPINPVHYNAFGEEVKL